MVRDVNEGHYFTIKESIRLIHHPMDGPPSPTGEGFLKTKKERIFMRSFGDPYENRTRVTAVKGRCLNLLTNGPYMVAAVGFEPTTCRV